MFTMRSNAAAAATSAADITGAKTVATVSGGSPDFRTVWLKERGEIRQDLGREPEVNGQQ